MLFLKKFFKNPRKVGAIAPSSKFLSKAIAQHAKGPIIVEIGAGTGSFTQDLLEKTTPQNFYVVELDEELYQDLKKKFPDLNVIKGDAVSLKDHLPSNIIGKIDTIVSGIPLLTLSKDTRKKIIDSCFDVLKKEGQILQFTYAPHCPVPAKSWGIDNERLEYVFMNVPPAFVWRLQKIYDHS